MKKRVRLGLLWCSVVLLCAPGARGQFTQSQKVVPSVRYPNARFGSSLAVEGNHLVVASHQENNFKGAVYVYEKASGTWGQTARLVANNSVMKDSLFGYNVAMAGNTLVVGGYKTVYVFEKSGNGWTQTQQLITPDGAFWDFYDGALLLSANTLLISCPQSPIGLTSSDFVAGAGAVYVYEKGGSSWTLTQKLVASDRAVYDHFGTSLALSGNLIAVGASYNDKDAAGGDAKDNAGALYVFEKTGSNWTQTQKLVASDRTALDHFGRSVVFAGDDLAVGAPWQHTDDANGQRMNAGAVYVFRKGPSGWTQTQKLVGSHRPITFGGSGVDGRFLAASGNLLVVSSHFQGLDVNGVNYLVAAGAVYLFGKNESNDWVQTQKLVASDRDESDVFGTAVGISGNDVLMGASGQELDNDENNKAGAGAVYSFTRTGFCQSLQSGEWTSATTWSCGHEPTNTDIVTINPGHTVVLSTNSAQALRVVYNGGTVKFSAPNSKMFVKGGD